MAEDARDEHARFIGSALDRHERGLVSYAWRFLGDLDAARDVVQETFLRLCREDRTRVESRLAPWLYTVCRRLAIDARRKRRANADPAALEAALAPGPHPAAQASRGDDAAAALAAVMRLPEKQQEVVLLKFRHGLAYHEIAEVTGLSESHVGVLIHEGMTVLRRTFRVASESAPARVASDGGTR